MSSIHYKFYFGRKNQTMKTFLEGISTLEDAVSKFSEYSLYGYDLEEVRFTIKENLETLILKPSKVKAEKKEIKKASSRKTSSSNSKNKKTTRTRRKRAVKKTTAEEKNSEKKQDDSSYFETWKVPYVEP